MVLLRWVFAAAVAMTCVYADRQRATAADERQAAVGKRQAPTNGDYADRSSDGSYAFRYADRNQFHSAAANKDNVVSGRFGSRSPETGRIVQTSYSSGPRGFRARGPDIARQTDLSQVRLPYSPPVPTDSSKYDPAYDRYYDPNEDPSYRFTVRTPTLSKSETADSRGYVEGVYSYLDDVGKRHDVQYEAGAGTGFHVKSAHPDSDAFGGVFYSGPPGKPGGQPRGHSSVVLGKDGSYGFTASGPDQRRSEVSDSSGRVQGSYTYLDDKGVQRTVQYVAGPEIGYRVVNNAAAGGASGLAIPPLLSPGGNVVVPSIVPPPSLLISSPSTPLLPSSAFEQDLFGPVTSTSTPLQQSDIRRRPESGLQINDIGGGSGGGGGSSSGVGGGNGGGSNSVHDEFLSPDSTLPASSAFPEDDPALPPKKWPTIYKNKNEASFFQSFEKFDKRRNHQQNGPNRPFAVPEPPLSSYSQPTARPQQSVSTARPTVPSASLAVVDTLYGQPSRPIIVDQAYGQYGGTDYQKLNKDHLEIGTGHVDNNFGGFPPGTVVKAHVQNLDILPFGYRVPSPSYVLEKQFGNNDGYQNSLKK